MRLRRRVTTSEARIFVSATPSSTPSKEVQLSKLEDAGSIRTLHIRGAVSSRGTLACLVTLCFISLGNIKIILIQMRQISGISSERMTYMVTGYETGFDGR